jgi:hypothetical protein
MFAVLNMWKDVDQSATVPSLPPCGDFRAINTSSTVLDVQPLSLNLDMSNQSEAAYIPWARK